MAWSLNLNVNVLFDRWYAEPGTVVNNSYTFKVKNEVAPVVQDMPFNGIPTSIPRASAPTASPVIKSSDLLADLDFFSTTTNTAAFNPPPKQSPFPQSISQPSFANFQNADFFFPGNSQFQLNCYRI